MSGNLYYARGGGVAGYVTGSSKVNNCKNNGAITTIDIIGSSQSGGIIGYITDSSSVSSCYNSGYVESNYYAGGIVGEALRATINDSYNTGNVVASTTEYYSYAGGISGVAVSVQIDRCYNTGEISSSAKLSHCGGISGNINDGDISQCYNLGEIKVSFTSYSQAGGITGYTCHKSKIDNSFNAGHISVLSYSSMFSQVGGITGEMVNGCSVANCYNVGVIETGYSKVYAGGIVGSNETSTIGKCYFLNNIEQGTAVGSGETISATHDEMSKIAIFQGFDFDTTWEFVEGNLYEYPTLKNDPHYVLSDGDFQGGLGTQDSPFLIASTKQLDNVRKYLDAHYKLVMNIVFVPDEDFAEGGEFYNEGNGWIPIGLECEFEGVFDGNGYTVKNLYAYNLDSAIPLGLFGINKGQIINLGIISCSITSEMYYAGGIAGVNKGYIGKCYNTGYISSSSRAGGITGLNGVKGVMAVIEECYNSGRIYAIDNTTYCGGIAGENIDGNISNCFNNGIINEKYYSGGILGHFYSGTLTGCYNIGDVEKELGINEKSSKKVIGTYYIYGSITHTNNYRLGEESYDYSDAKQRTTYELQSEQTFIDWDFDSIWTMAGNECYPYPELKNVTMLSNHMFENSCDTSCDCGYIRTITHKYKPEFDSETHFESCTVCGKIRNAKSHEFENSCDASCDCGYTRSITHDYQSAFNTIDHFEECTVCKEFINLEPHEFDNPCDATCDCGYTRTVTHNYKSTFDTKNHFLKCSKCDDIINTKPHNFDNDCDDSCVCGYIRTDIHNYKLLFDEEKHFEKCVICGDVININAHKFDDDLCESCNCGYINHDYKWVIDKPSSCGEEGKKHEECKECYATRNENTIIEATGVHTYDNTCDIECNVCSKVREITHNYRAYITQATTSKDGEIVKKCSVCGSVYSSTTIKHIKTIKLSTTSYTYNGEVKTPTMTIKDSADSALKKDTDYIVSYPSGRKNAGTYKVYISFRGNYSGSKTLSFKINPISVSKCEMALSKISYTYDGKSKIPSVTVLNHNGTKLTDSSYVVTYAKGRKNVGTYKVTVTLKGNYSGKEVLTFKIIPPKTSIKKVTAGKKSLKVSVSKKTKEITGYEIQYSTSKKFKSAKKVTIKKAKTTSATIKKLKAKKTYYVRVRTYKTVKGKKYYSGWSSCKKAKTK